MGDVQELSVGPSGGVVLGEQGQAAFAIVNDGALEVQFQISSDAQVSSDAQISSDAQPCSVSSASSLQLCLLEWGGGLSLSLAGQSYS